MHKESVTTNPSMNYFFNQSYDQNSLIDLRKVSDKDILSNLEKLVKSERKIMHLVLCHILEVENRKLFFQLGYESIYKYLTQYLGYAEDAAYDRMQAARVLKLAPSVTEKLQEGSINLTQLVKVNQCLKQEKKLGNGVTAKQTEELIAKIENKTNFETEKLLAIELNQAPKLFQKIRPQADESVRVEMTFSKADFEIIKEAQSLLSHIVVENDHAQAYKHLAKKLIESKKGKKNLFSGDKETRQTEKSPSFENKESQKTEDLIGIPTQSFSLIPESESGQDSSQRNYLSVHIRRAVMTKANYRCEHVDPKSKRRCNSKFQLQVDHIKPLAKGGTDEIQNLRALCGIHNRYEALRWGLWGPH